MPSVHALRPHHGETVADARLSVRDLCEVAASEFLPGAFEGLSFIHDLFCPVKHERAVIRRHHIHRSVFQRAPESSVVFRPAHGRRTYVFGAFPAAVHIRFREHQVLRAGLTMHIDAEILDITQQIRLFRAVHVDDIDRRVAGRPGKHADIQEFRSGAVLGAGPRVPDRVCMAGLQRFRDLQIDQVPVFDVEHGDDPVFFRHTHRLKDLPVLEPHPAVIGGEHLDGIDPQLRQFRDLGKAFGREAGVIHMDAVIHRGFSGGILFPDTETVRQRREIMIGKVDHRRRPAERRRLGPGIVIIGRGRVRHRQIQMDMSIHPAGQDQHSRRIDHLRIGDPVKILSDRGDFFPVDQNICDIHCGVGNDRPAFNDFLHKSPPFG